MNEDLITKFMSRVQLPENENGCWLWTGSRHKRRNKNYGICHFKFGKEREAHRVSYSLFKGSIPKGKQILHNCDNPPCVRPEHLRAGTAQDNVDDREKRGRSRHLSGENHGRAKLTWEQVRNIRAEYIPHIMGQHKLSKKYKVTKRLIRLILERKIWKEPTAISDN